ncbi:Chromosome segregation ATPase-like protein (plasmid) [Haloterrigena turkmenica DSM 5511]|uniref:Chromosome segregation ATPase-like protein n=1 Tax=Haloterrigena turkmenica (strain ATCC 51198 / DSM 5511 / JCM 9101 / NCIMB 13204 / VKM B-1734 / 4k) TaxID=543526 RepID=D2S0B2_HALTV|nr:archaea-specific SMC-related protein [Haloterrigena turkmenica]ADB62809.1 Chromosome segregation ATPase-like protein [Haloterrigena turkmenica DSM 5511]
MTWNIEIENIAGILDGETTIEPGLNAVRGSNWQGKSSFIEAIKTALGTSTELTENEDSGRVQLRTPDREIAVELVRENGSVRRSGTPYLENEYDVIRAELFACLDERNVVRSAVRRGKNLEDVLLRPLDFQNIDEQIADLKREREQIQSELSQAREAKKRLPGVQEQVTQLEKEIKELREKRDEIAVSDADDGTSDDEDDESPQQQLSEVQTERSQAKNRIERLERTIERTEERLEQRRSELESIEIPADDDVESELASAREQLQQLKRDSEVLQSVYSANEMVLKEGRLDLLTEVERELTADTVVCWTCGNEAQREEMEERLNHLGDKITELRARTEQYHEKVKELETRREEIDQTKRRKRDLEREITELEETLADRRQSLEEAEKRYRNAQEHAEELSDAVDETVEAISDVESKIKYREAELKDTRDELSQLETRADQVEMLESESEEIRTEIEELRNRKDRIKRRAREAFDEAMDEILSRFGTGFETARLTADFDLVVARDGREASLDALSEGELELIGFVAALAGYESFDVDETVPLLLVDGVGGLADDNLHTLIDYLHERTNYLVFTAYPEYTSFEGREIDPSNWSVATNRQVRTD